MEYFADLHIHSKYSIATSRDCNLVELTRWAALKGIRVLATGDFTHPQWASEIDEMLEETEDGLLRLKDQYIEENIDLPGGFGPREVRFILNVEISSIYKKYGSARRVHNLIFVPDRETMRRLNSRLDRIGNIRSDGRPILGLDSRDLLEITLETNSESFMVPAHIWTPWFSVLGSKSGFDSIEECFGDLTPHIFALETGLSSDPEMNRRVGSLDDYALISNSDTHSPSKLGREVNIFDGKPGYRAIREAIRSSARRAANDADEARFIGTLEFFPEEGKYHLDGHRKCSVRMDPQETEKLGKVCPVCGHALTVGVVNRVLELADSESGNRPGFAPFWRMLPLVEVIAQAMDSRPQSKKVVTVYHELLRQLGPELTILWSMDLDTISGKASPLIAEALRRVRSGDVSIQPGFDGEYGTVTLFGAGEREKFMGQESFLSAQKPASRRSMTNKSSTKKKTIKTEKTVKENSQKSEVEFNDQQMVAITTFDRPVLVQAGPGTGKTRTLTGRIARAIAAGTAEPEQIIAVTFTRKAAKEVQERLESLMPAETAQKCWVGTFHQLGRRILDHFSKEGLFEGGQSVLDKHQALDLFRQAMKAAGMKIPGGPSAMFDRISLLKQNLVPPGDSEDADLGRAYSIFQEHMLLNGALDLDDLLLRPVELLKSNPGTAEAFRGLFARHLLVDEFQDVNRAQYEMIRLLATTDGSGLFVIGDPDQAIYGFRGADRKFFLRFHDDYPSACRIGLVKNYRSTGTILKAAQQVLNDQRECEELIPQRSADSSIKIVRLPNQATEAEFISRTIDSAIGGVSFFSLDSGRAGALHKGYGFRDFAVLFRLNAVGDALEEALESSGIPFQRTKRQSPEEEAEAFDPRVEAVTLMTIHAAKGLEFPVVFIAGCEEGIIPHIPAHASSMPSQDMDEERRLLYVAMTRAADELFVTCAALRSLHGRSCELPQSHFLAEMDKSLCEFQDPLAKRKPKAPRQCNLFS
ncbi:MAG: UvrD-helicase domain-containing protein [Desulfomonile tiedjei]|uniref:DNA 3'-5' helicase n=1 Tax=Desulfomonile tiedjei TaxID=2358 RepID=A0A9D6UZC1_9BACT|nr:UvrD-helicase domain-containing protein [Desulfomonile tiedjei]